MAENDERHDLSGIAPQSENGSPRSNKGSTSNLTTMARPRKGTEPMSLHSFRCADDAWEAAKAKAEERGEILGEELRKFIERYGKRK